MTSGETLETTSDERVMAALAHFFGAIAALLVWATQKDKSRFVRFQALQALAFGALLMVVNLAMMVCVVGVAILAAIAAGVAIAQTPNSSQGFGPLLIPPMAFPMSMFICVTPITLVALAIQTIAAVSVASGRSFRYPWIASRVDALLGESATATV